jgi:hypothetical protein
MGRAFLTIIFPLLLPTGLYIAWRLGLGRAINLPAMWIWLLVAGVVLVSLTLVLVSTDFGRPQEGIYVPPHLSDGQIVPGHLEPGPVSPAPAR